MEGRKRGGGRSGREAASGAAPGTPEFFEEQYRAIEESLERALAERVATAQGRPASRGAAVAGGEAAGWRRWRPEIYFAVTLVGLAALWWRGRGGAAAPAAEEPGGWLVPALFVAAAVAAAALVAWVAYRLGRSQGGGAAAGQPRGRRASSVGPSPSVQTLAGIGGALVVVALLLFGARQLGWWGGEPDAAAGVAPPAREAPVVAELPPDDGTAGPAASEPDPVPEDADAAWRALLDERREAIAAALSAASRREGLAAEQISDFQADAFADRAARLRAGDLAGTDADNIRRGLFEYAYALQEARSAAAGVQRRARISLGFTDFQTAVLGDLLRRLDLDDSFAPPYDPLDPTLQVAVLDRWLARGGTGGAAAAPGGATP